MTRKPNPALRHATHHVYGSGEVLAVRQLDSGQLVADVKFLEETRTIQLNQAYWSTPIADLMPTPKKKPVKRARKTKEAPATLEKALVS